MQAPAILPIDVTAIVAIVMGMLVVLIPIAGLTARFALKPVVESFSKLFHSRTVEETLALTERRVALLESQLESVHEEMSRMSEAQEFDRRLAAGGSETAPDRASTGPGSEG